MSVVHIVHCIDTEGPLDEFGPSLNMRSYEPGTLSTARLNENFWEEVKLHRPRTLGSWQMIADMLKHVTAPKFRNSFPDSFSGGWKFNWFCMDHLNFVDNPRGRDMGIHRVFDFYQNIVQQQQAGDGLHWHFHSMSTYGEANKSAVSYMNSPLLREIIGRRLLDKKFFPKANRAGFHDERPDAHWFLEQWIPFDLSNRADTQELNEEINADLKHNRYGDWRGAPTDWSTYHPDHDAHQIPGNCRRKIARCLLLLNRFGNLNEAELEKAFRRAAEGKPTLVGLCSHDWRDMAPEIEYVHYLLKKVSMRFPEVPFKFSEAVEAFNAVHPPKKAPAVKLKCTLSHDEKGCRLLEVETVNGKAFGPQPFFVVRTRSQRIIHDWLNYGNDRQSWNYVFDDQSILPDDVRDIGIAVNDDAGNQSIHVLNFTAEQRKIGQITF